MNGFAVFSCTASMEIILHEGNDQEIFNLHVLIKCWKLRNPFQAQVSFLYTLKMSEYQRFSAFFRGYKIGTLACSGLKTNHENIVKCCLISCQ